MVILYIAFQLGSFYVWYIYKYIWKKKWVFFFFLWRWFFFFFFWILNLLRRNGSLSILQWISRTKEYIEGIYTERERAGEWCEPRSVTSALPFFSALVVVKVLEVLEGEIIKNHWASGFFLLVLSVFCDNISLYIKLCCCHTYMMRESSCFYWRRRQFRLNVVSWGNPKREREKHRWEVGKWGGGSWASVGYEFCSCLGSQAFFLNTLGETNFKGRDTEWRYFFFFFFWWGFFLSLDGLEGTLTSLEETLCLSWRWPDLRGDFALINIPTSGCAVCAGDLYTWNFW